MAPAHSRYVELQVVTHHSLLRGASSPNELFAAASLLGYRALGVADWNTVGGLVRAWDAQKATGVRLIPGARIEVDNGRSLLLYPTDRAAWSRLTRLLTLGKSRAGKGRLCTLGWSDVAARAEGLVAILLPDEADAITQAHLDRAGGSVRPTGLSRPGLPPPSGRPCPASRPGSHGPDRDGPARRAWRHSLSCA